MQRRPQLQHVQCNWEGILSLMGAVAMCMAHAHSLQHAVDHCPFSPTYHCSHLQVLQEVAEASSDEEEHAGAVQRRLPPPPAADEPLPPEQEARRRAVLARLAQEDEEDVDLPSVQQAKEEEVSSWGVAGCHGGLAAEARQAAGRNEQPDSCMRALDWKQFLEWLATLDKFACSLLSLAAGGAQRQWGAERFVGLGRPAGLQSGGCRRHCGPGDRRHCAGGAARWASSRQVGR